jgi:hypothetical protein
VPTLTDAASQQAPDFLRRDATEDAHEPARAELLLETHRVTGSIEHSSSARRLVDILNAIDGPIAVVRDAAAESLANPSDGPHHFKLLHVKRQAILLAVPQSDGSPPPDSVEAVEKQPAAATLILPSLEITGHVHLPPEADPGAVRLLGRRDFLPVTEAEVTETAFGFHRWRRPLVVVNLARALLYAPAPR